jgi:Chaperone of endosialidase
METTTLQLRNSMNRSPLQRAFQLILLVIAFFALLLSAQAQLPSPSPDGAYPNGNTAEGSGALQNLTTGAFNTAMGANTLSSTTNTSYNTATGAYALYNNTGSYNTASGYQTLVHNASFENTATGYVALNSNTTGNQNTATGVGALQWNTMGSLNTATGLDALLHNTTGSYNTATGTHALTSNAGSYNTAVGSGALNNNTTGNYNIAIGRYAGSNLTIGSNNIDIGAYGAAGESNTMRIGAQGNQTKTFIVGIRGVTTGKADAIPVVIDSAGQLGTVSSSARFKKDIKPMDQRSEAILALKPVTFHYKSDTRGIPQFGLIAEEVAKVNPDLVVRDTDGQIYTVRYDAVNAMLLNEFLKEHKTVQQLRSTVEKQQAIIAEQQKGMEGLTAQLKEQAAQIQKVAAELETTKAAPAVVLNN